MPQLNDRQRTAMQRLTDRQLEALAHGCLGKSVRSRWDGRGTRSNMGGAANRMVEELRSNGLLDREYSINHAGVDAVLVNIGRVPELRRAEVKAAAERIKPDLDAKADRAAADAETARQERQVRADRRKAEREAAIPPKLAQLAGQCGIGITGTPENCVRLWDAIVSADMAL